MYVVGVVLVFRWCGVPIGRFCILCVLYSSSKMRGILRVVVVCVVCIVVWF